MTQRLGATCVHTTSARRLWRRTNLHRQWLTKRHGVPGKGSDAPKQGTGVEKGRGAGVGKGSSNRLFSLAKIPYVKMLKKTAQALQVSADNLLVLSTSKQATRNSKH